jgi:hypothetical protein
MGERTDIRCTIRRASTVQQMSYTIHVIQIHVSHTALPYIMPHIVLRAQHITRPAVSLSLSLSLSLLYVLRPTSP